ncbi:hypothetical protein CDAR_211711 [Caerostris darwini]|uniref:Uncharacterized protein n=1 Tax=Caerostris darwini TaxID=1538125 RepID=A0AAV4PBY4_9ARAC|nr:hypothetical protein CDAR_211711 [Caerostris darwini]
MHRKWVVSSRLNRRFGMHFFGGRGGRPFFEVRSEGWFHGKVYAALPLLLAAFNEELQKREAHGVFCTLLVRKRGWQEAHTPKPHLKPVGINKVSQAPQPG